MNQGWAQTTLPTLPTHQQTDQAIVQLYHEQDSQQLGFRQGSLTITERLENISRQLLGKPYLLGALGEGENAAFDQSPLYRMDRFDCETFVDTVLALTFSHNLDEFQHHLCQIRYKNGQVDFITRNHFTDLDWNKNNQAQGYLQDISQKIKDANQQPVSLIASATINKPAWYQHLTPAAIKLRHPDPVKQKHRLALLQKQGQQLPISQSTIHYIPLSALFDGQGRANDHLFAQIPNGAIIEIIRPNWDLTDKIGTHLNVSHLGFVFWKNGDLIFREASSEYHQVVDVPLKDYLRMARKSPTIKGINIQVIKSAM